MKILVIGGGAREHALCWAIERSPLCEKLYCAPGNFGISGVAECVDIAITEIDKIVQFAVDNHIDFVMVGPEQPLVMGLADRLRARDILVFGPSQQAAQLEGSKGYLKDLCREFGIPTAAYERVYDMDAAQRAIAKNLGGKIVIKADGLAAGKGVIIAENADAAMDAAEELLGDGDGQHASLVIEEFMDGEEASFFALVDGETTMALCAAQDHKRVFDGDKGPNTGGMGAYSPAPVMPQSMIDLVMEKIINPTARAMVKRGAPFRGVLFAGLMITRDGPKLIEYNARFGDPECQVIMPRLNGDWLAYLLAVANGTLDKMPVPSWHDITTLAVVYAAKGYPGDYEKNTEIRGLEKLATMAGVSVFHAATKYKNGQVLATGGRVLSVVAEAINATEAQRKAYAAIAHVYWPGGFYRRDIGYRAVEREKSQLQKKA